MFDRTRGVREMRDYIVELLNKRLEADSIWDDQSLEAVRAWFVASDGRSPVVLVGSGFSRNARFSDGRLADSLPTWKGLTRHMTSRLFPGFWEQGGTVPETDPLRLAQLYVEQFGKCCFTNDLLQLVEDDALQAGPAHQALYAYPVEAVITTNQLDTLLDKNGGWWTSVVTDSDLSRHDPGRPAKQLIYLHGHRSQPDTWVFTQNEYEDIFTHKPIIITRVRQLLAQFPVLIVGYSLSDPDFHSIYRRVSIDMRKGQPRGLAILTEEPHRAMRKHWEDLGLMLAVIRIDGTGSGEVGERLRRFFAVSPARVAPLGSYSDLLETMSCRQAFSSRLHFFDEYIQDPLRHKNVEAGGPPLDYELWRAVGEFEFTESELSEIRNWFPPQLLKALEHAPLQGGVKFVGPVDVSGTSFFALPSNRFFPTSDLARLVDQLLGMKRCAKSDVAEWLWRGMQLERFQSDAGNRLGSGLANLVSWLWGQVAGSGASWDSAPCPYSSASVGDVLDTCLEMAERDGDAAAVEAIKADIAKLGSRAGGEGQPSRPEMRRSDPHSRGEVQISLRRAFDLALNGEASAALKEYLVAMELAQKAGDVFRRWLAIRGCIWAHTVEKRPVDDVTDSWFKSIRQALGDIEASPIVSAWLRRSEQGDHAILAKRLDDLEERERKRLTGSERIVYDDVVFNYWRIFRELESKYAPPSLQRSYLQHLVCSGAYKPVDELNYRLTFDLDKTPAWAKSLVGSLVPDSIPGRKDRDRAIFQQIVSTPRHKSGWKPRLCLMPMTHEIAQADQFPGIPAFLNACREQIGTTAMTGRGLTHLFREYPEAWLTWARYSAGSVALPELREYSKRIDINIEREEFLSGMPSLPWNLWSIESPANLDVSIELLMEIWNNGSEKQTTLGKLNGLLWTSYYVLGAAQVNGGNPHLDRIKELAAICLEDPRTPQDAYRAAVAFLHRAEEKDSVSQLITTLSASLLKRMEAAKAQGVNGLELGCAVASDLLDDGVPASDLGSFLERLLGGIQGSLESIVSSSAQPNGDALHFCRFLGHSLAAGAQRTSTWGADTLFRLVRLRAGGAQLLARTLDPSLWGRKWEDVVDFIWTSTHGRAGALGKTGVVGMVDARPRGESTDFPAELRDIPSICCSMVADENQLVANHSAFCVAKRAGFLADGDHDLQSTLSSLRRISADPRTLVRMAAARHVPRLAAEAKSDEMRELAKRLGEQLGGDPYATIQTALRWSKLETKPME